MNRRGEMLATLAVDIVMLCLAWGVYYLLRVRSGWIPVTLEPDLLAPMVFILLYWLLVFFFVGLYRSWYAASRLDEILLVFKSTLLGCLFLFFVIFVDDVDSTSGPSARLLIVMYWVILFVFVSGGRVLLRGVQRRLLIAGIGTRRTVIVGSAARARNLLERVRRYPRLGYNVIGFVSIDRRWGKQAVSDVPLLGRIEQLHELLPRQEVQEVLIALDSSDHDRLMQIVT